MQQLVKHLAILGTITLFLATAASAQYVPDLPNPLCIGDNGHPECEPTDPWGLEVVLEVWYPGDEATELRFEYAQVAPANRYQNHVYVNDVLVGTLPPSADESDCTTYDPFVVDITAHLWVNDPEHPDLNTIIIVSGYNENEDNYDDVWLRNIEVTEPAVSNNPVSWSEVKALY